MKDKILQLEENEGTLELDNVLRLIGSIKSGNSDAHNGWLRHLKDTYPDFYLRTYDIFYKRAFCLVGSELVRLKHAAGYNASLDVYGLHNDFERFGFGDYSKVLMDRDPLKYILGYIDFVGDEPEPTYEKDEGSNK